MRAAGLALAFALIVGACVQTTADYCASDTQCPSQHCNHRFMRCDPVGGTLDPDGLPHLYDAGDGGPDVVSTTDSGVDSPHETVATCMPACSGTTPVCDLSILMCVGCLGKSDCTDPTKPVCDTTVKDCVGCIGSTDCSDPTKPVCDTTAKACVGCLANPDCMSSTAPICDTTAKTCGKCAVDAQCAARDATEPACDTTSGACFPCVNSKKHCPAAAPICDANACRICKKDAECATAYGADPGVCASDGHCASGTEVIYSQNSASCSSTARGDGSLASPFCFTSDAGTALSAQKPIIVMRGSRSVNEPLVLNFAGAPVLVVGQNGANYGTVVGTPPLVSITAGDVTLRDLTISGGPGIGVSATGGTLRMTRCQVLGNTKSGIDVSSTAFDITNTVVGGNMGSTAVSLGTYTGPGPTRFAFNTVVVTNAGTAVFCGQNYALKGLLVAANGTAFGGSCATDATTSTDAPQFDPARPYHLTATSPCVDKGGTTNIPPDDIDGDTRPQGPAADCGADEWTP